MVVRAAGDFFGFNDVFHDNKIRRVATSRDIVE
jgi:hypothetical protein